MINLEELFNKIGNAFFSVSQYYDTMREQTLSPASSWHQFVDLWLPIISTFIVIASAVAAVIKFYYEKHREYRDKMLTEVYSPLFEYIVKQEYVRSANPDAMPLDKYPLISVINRENYVTNSEGKLEMQTYENVVFSIEDMQDVTKKINFGLVPSEILVLLSALYVAINKPDVASDEELISLKTSLRNEIISGYIKLYGKRRFSRNRYIEKKGDTITFSFKMNETMRFEPWSEKKENTVCKKHAGNTTKRSHTSTSG